MKLGLLLSKETPPLFRGCYIRALAPAANLGSWRKTSIHLRELDEQNLTSSWQKATRRRVVLALMNRLRKAAAEIIKA